MTDDLSPCDKLAIRHEALVDENIKLRAEIDELQQVARKSYMDLQREYMLLEQKYHDLKEQHDVMFNSLPTVDIEIDGPLLRRGRPTRSPDATA